MAEALLRKAFSDSNANLSVSSAGIGALVNYPADKIAQDLMAERGLDISQHRARQLDETILRESSLVLVMEDGHRKAVLEMDPTARGKVYLLCETENLDVPDPYRMPRNVFESCLIQIEKGAMDWANRLKDF